MVFHGFWLVSMVFQGGFMVLVGFHGFQGGFMVFGWFPWFFKVILWVFMDFWLVSMVFQGGFIVFHGFWLVYSENFCYKHKDLKFENTFTVLEQNKGRTTNRGSKKENHEQASQKF